MSFWVLRPLSFALVLTLLSVGWTTANAQPLTWPLGHGDLRPRAADASVVEPVAFPRQKTADEAMQTGPLHTASTSQVMDDHQPLRRQVWGYLPYWEMNAQVQWDLLTHLLYFVVEIDEYGLVREQNGWGGSAVAQLVSRAREAEVEVILTVSNFNDDEIDLILREPGRRAAMISTCLELLALHDADGINVDFEFVPLSARDAFVSFMTDLKTAVANSVSPGRSGHVSIAGPSVDWEGAYDYDALLAATDGIMVMAYGYYWPGGDPGPTSPLYGGGAWSDLSIDWTVDDYLFWGGEDNRGRVILGLPWYGHSWPVQDPEVPTTASGQGVALSFSEIAIDAAEHEATLEPLTRSLYFHKQQAGQLWQVWFEDPSAFAERLQYVEQRDIGGIGIWALGYEGSQTAYWDAIRDAWLAPPTGPVDRHPSVEDAGQIDDVDSLDGEGADVDDDAAASGPDGSDDHPADNPLVTQQESSDLVMRRGCHGAGRGGSGSWFALCVVAMATLASRRWLRV